MIDFIPPDFVSGSTPEEIQQRMMNNLPDDIDDMPGGFPYDFTMPTALEKSELIQFHLVRTLMLMFPMWAWGEWLDYHADAAGIKRRPAGFASGRLIIYGEAGTKISENVIFATPATDSASSIEFKTNGEYEISESGSVEVEVIAVEAGTESNVGKNTVVLMSRPVKGIISVINPEAITGGTEKENDDSLRQRIQEANMSRGDSYVGNDSDYIRWAKEVTGVGDVMIIPLWNGPGTVKIVLIDANGEPANKQILDAVYEHIVSPDNRLERLAPIGAEVTVAAPVIKKISYSAKIFLNVGYEMKNIKSTFEKEISEYYKTVRETGIIKYHKAFSILSNVRGINDFSEFLLNGSTDNISVLEDEYPGIDLEGLVEV